MAKKQGLVEKHWALALGLFAMLMLVAGTFSPGGSLQQRVLFVIGAPLLGITAYAGRQKMFTVLQAVATVGTVIAFFTLPDMWKYGIMACAGLLGFFYLFRSGYFKEDRYGAIGALGLASFALGFATDASRLPLLFDVFFISGGVMVAAYSATSLMRGVKIAAIWVVLNLLLIVNPLIDLLGRIGA